ncbi:hypothetical protein ACO0LM_04480 [Undibacterium sp. Di26W]|uniref:hypothetical protein n=1 Tax=Undibacterium sp. Di26W TaxID=3413035 RepID=UPI003BF2A408
MNWGVSGFSVIAGISGAVAALTGAMGFFPMCVVCRKPVARQSGEGAWVMTASVQRDQLRWHIGQALPD